MDDNILNELRTWTGRSKTLHSDLPALGAQALSAALNQTRPPARGDQLPLPWHWLYFLEPTRRENTGEDGHPLKGDFLPPVPLSRRMWAAGTLEIQQPLVLGLDKKKVSTITSVEAKNGRSGPLVFVNLKHEFSQGDNLCMSEEQNLVYRDAPGERTELPPGELATEEAEFTREVKADPVMLFRYSALTYNSHRIHYDREYAVNTELYPALVVHGPLLATLILDLAYEHLPSVLITKFKFRAVRPTFDNHPFTLCGKLNGSQLLLWSEDHNGYLCMKAEATISAGR